MPEIANNNNRYFLACVTRPNLRWDVSVTKEQGNTNMPVIVNNNRYLLACVTGPNPRWAVSITRELGN